MSSLFARLKADTQQQHREMEAMVDPIHTFSALETYKAHLSKTYVFHASLEVDLSAQPWSDVGIDFVARRKTGLLEQDLRILGVPRPSPEGGHFPRGRNDLSFALGCLYVLEGATLGGQIISRHLATLGIGPANGGMFFNGYGARTGAMWKSFKASAAEYCVNDDQIDAAVHGAIWAFERFRDSMVRGKVISDAA